MTNIFEQAARQKVRFDTTRGQLSAEDLWDLPLQSAAKVSLDSIAIAIDNDLKTQNVSFVSDVTPRNTLSQLKFDLVKHVITTKKEEAATAATARAKAEKKQQLLAVLDRRQNEAVENMTEEQIREALESL